MNTLPHTQGQELDSCEHSSKASEEVLDSEEADQTGETPNPNARYYLKDAVLEGGIPFNGMTALEYNQGVEHVAGDMFVSVPKADAIFMKWICDDWSDEHCLKLLKNCYDALPENGKVIVAECILPVAPDSSLATKGVVHIDVIILAHNPSGKERTEKEFEALAKGAGFKGFQVLCDAFSTYVMEFLKTAQVVWH